MEASPTGKLKLAGQVAVISGGLGDIGRAIAHRLRAAGAHVALSDLRPAAIARQVMPGFHYTRSDVTQSASVEAWLARVERDLGTPSLIVCNAGIVEPAMALATTDAIWKRTLDINLSGSFFLSRSAAQRMVKKKLAGRIVFVGSWAAHAPHPRITAYSVAKAGLRMTMECLALELASHDILVNEIAPGKVDAGLSAQLMKLQRGARARTRRSIPIGKLLEADDVAHGVLYLCEPDNCHMTGAVLLQDGGLSLVRSR